ncbi:uncharacterized protein E0L32_005989 [Thyridium curvatum]|uniref:Uncharacterized protein n=1 Tax=Thyridium curvatum TaxID=1093900 RepID=A0A507B9R0_9PEZI|nr:uncharacterized protein E0L32_005989 [Thyridium curvatum]TPX13518.1 hypothetical protein E0L32_005989 [Thyridium curvatum]
MCVSSVLNGRRFTCGPTYASSNEQLYQQFFPTSNQATTAKPRAESATADLSDLIVMAHSFQTTVQYAILAGSGVFFFLSLVCFLNISRLEKRESGPTGTRVPAWGVTMMIFGQYALGLAIAAGFATLETVKALEFSTAPISNGKTEATVHIDATLQGLQWASIGLLFIYHCQSFYTFWKITHGEKTLPSFGPLGGGRPGPMPNLPARPMGMAGGPAQAMPPRPAMPPMAR